MKEICKDLEAEHEALDLVVANLDEKGWDTVTYCWGWTIRDEISHLAYIDGTSKLAVVDKDVFIKHVKEMPKDFDKFHDLVLSSGRGKTGPEMLAWWRENRSDLVKVLEPLDPKDRLPWYGPSMSAKSFATARLMETWMHGHDIVDILKADRPLTDRLQHIAHLGVVTFGWSFATNQLEVPKVPVRIELTSPSGKLWEWGPKEADNLVRGSAEAFCLVVGRRRNIADTSLEIKGAVAKQWMEIGQIFAGPAEEAPKAGAFPKMK